MAHRHRDPPPDTSPIEVIEVDRSFIEERGWPASWEWLEAFTASEPRVRAKTVSGGDFTVACERAGAVAWFRQGNHDAALLYQQGWSSAP